jgi:hypothetical protein
MKCRIAIRYGVLAAAAIVTWLFADVAAAQQEGVHVRGDWTIVVRNEDGTIASRHDFRNAFVPSLGGPLLANLLKNNSVVAEWSISMQGGPCLNSSGQPGNCILVQNPAWVPQAPTQYFATLTTDVPTSGPNAGKLVLTGSAKAGRATGITTVTTFGHECPAGSTTCNGLSGPQRTFTHHSFIGPAIIQVAAGQTIDVTVVISFS